MIAHFPRRSIRGLSPVVAVCFLTVQLAWVFAGTARASSTDDLKTIEYRHYFRGNYKRAIEELRAYLEREDLKREDIVEAREFLAASLILTGATDEGKDQFLKIMKLEPGYAGPDPAVFKTVVISTFEQVRSEYASTVIRNAPQTKIVETSPPSDGGAQGEKPVYKKWWFYAALGAVVLALAGAASGGGGSGDTPPAQSGTITVEVGIR